MDGSSAVHTLRWKQICAGALSAASLIAGHLVFGQELQPIRRTDPANVAPIVTSAAMKAEAKPTSQETLAPILNARPKPRPMPAPPTTAAPTVRSKPTGEALPPVVDSSKLPKPSGATTTAEQRPVATLQLAPSGSSSRPQNPSSVSPWMVDINEALARKPAEEKTAAPARAASEAARPPSSRKTAETKTETTTETKTETKTDRQPAQQLSTAGNLPVVQLGSPQATTIATPSTSTAQALGMRSPADLRKPSSQRSESSPQAQVAATPRLNPFTAPADNPTKPAVATRLPAIERSPAPVTNNFLATPDHIAATAEPAASTPEAPEIAPPSQPTVDVPSRTEAATAASPLQPESVASEAPEVAAQPKATKPAAQHALPFENRYVADRPVAEPNHRQEEELARSLPPVTQAANSTRKPTSTTARASAALLNEPGGSQRHGSNPADAGTRLQLTGYELGARAIRTPAEAPVQTQQPAFAPASAAAGMGMRFVQAEAPAAPIEPAAEAPRPLPPGGPDSPFEMIGESGSVSVMVRRSMLLRTHTDIYRTAVVDPAICDVIQFTPREISIIGKSQGSTHVTFWFEGPNAQPITYLVKVEPDAAEVKKEEDKYKLLEDVVNEMFPDSKIQLLLVADKLIVKGQAKDSEEATQILSIIRTNAGGNGGGMWGPGGWSGGAGGGLSEGAAADVLSDSATGSAARARYQVINMLRVPGVQQVALRVKIAELNRTAARGFGVDVHGNIAFSDSPEGTDLFFNSILNVAGGGAPALLAQFDGDDISVGIRYLQQQGVIRLLSEPTLVTMSGRPATFVAGGEFAVPTVVGSAGLNAVTTDFRAFGAIISFLPTVVDKDRIRLEVSPEFSQINQDLAVNGTPGLKTRAVTTTVEMREGQTFAIAGLLEDNMNGTTIGDLPFLAQIFGRRSMQRAETELIILVTPELVHPMEAEEVPPLPGFDVTEPDNCQFFLGGKIEGTPTREYRSTVWPRLKNRYKAGAPAMTSGPFGHGH